MSAPPTTIIWARKSSPPENTPVLLWNSFGFESQHPDSVSLPTYIENHAEEIRSRLLSFLCEVKFVHDGKASLEEALLTPEGLSAWWLSFPSLKQWGKRQSIPIACRLIAVELIVGTAELSTIRIEADDPQLDELITRVIKHESFRRDRVHQIVQRRLIHPIRAVGSLVRYIWHTRTLSETRLQHSASGQSDFAFFDYFAGYERDKSTQVEYRSPYWGDAPNLIKNPDWFHIYPRNVDHLGIELTQREIARLNAMSGSTHFLFLGKIHVRDFSQLFRTFLSQRRVHRRFRKKLMSFKTEGSALELWGVFEEEWDDSIIGSTAMRHLILLKTTNNFVKNIPRYSKIFYLMENQPWDMALAFCIRRHRKGRLIGVAHSTIRFWDLRYFSTDSENYLVNLSSSRPSPDQILANGDIGKQLLLDNHYPADSISVVEALRYMYLKDLQRSDYATAKHVLLLGDFLESANSVLVSTFRDALDIVAKKFLIKVRSHPICPLTEQQLGNLTDSVSFDNLADLLEQASVVITTAASSSAAEAVVLGIPTIVVLDAGSLNYSPFRQSNNVYMVESAKQLADLLKDVTRLYGYPTRSIFCIDPNYSRWRTEFSST